MESKIWYTSDTHFGHKRTLELSKRPFKTVEEMDETLINNWNSVVEDNDIIYHLGDFGNYEISHKLKGNIYLLFGNYEHQESHNFGYQYGDYDKYLLENFNFKDIMQPHLKPAIVHKYNINGQEQTLYCVHQPTHLKNLKHPFFGIQGSFSDKFKPCEHEFCLFGHIHKLQMVKRFGLNVSSDCHNFYPIDLDTIFFYKNAIVNHYDDDVFVSTLDELFDDKISVEVYSPKIVPKDEEVMEVNIISSHVTFDNDAGSMEVFPYTKTPKLEEQEENDE